MPVNPNYYVARPLNNLVLERMAQDFGPDNGYLSDVLMPWLPVTGPTGIVIERKRALHRLLTDSQVARGRTDPTQSLPDWTSVPSTYLCVDEAQAAKTPIADLGNSESNPQLQDRAGEVSRVQDVLMLRHEIKVMTTITTEATYTTDAPNNFKSGVASSPSTNEFIYWDNASATPLQDLESYVGELIRTSGKKPDFIIIPHPVMAVLKFNAKWTLPNSGVVTGIVTPENLKDWFGFKDVFVPQTVYDTVALGSEAANDMTFVWGNNIIIGSRPTAPSLQARSFGYTFTQTDLTGGMPPKGYRVRSWTDPSLGQGVFMDVLEAKVHRKVLDPTLYMCVSTPITPANFNG